MLAGGRSLGFGGARRWDRDGCAALGSGQGGAGVGRSRCGWRSFGFSAVSARARSLGRPAACQQATEDDILDAGRAGKLGDRGRRSAPMGQSATRYDHFARQVSPGKVAFAWNGPRRGLAGGGAALAEGSRPAACGGQGRTRRVVPRPSHRRGGSLRGDDPGDGQGREAGRGDSPRVSSMRRESAECNEFLEALGDREREWIRCRG
jgi:hypothetical protein